MNEQKGETKPHFVVEFLFIHRTPKKGKNKEVIDTLEKRVPECLLSKSQHFMHRCLYKHFLNANSSIWGSKIQQGTRKTFVD